MAAFSLVNHATAAICQMEAATRIENDRYTVDVEAADGTFTMATKPGGKIVLPAGKLSGTGGTAKAVELTDKSLGKGKGSSHQRDS